MPGLVKKPKRRRDDIRVTMINRGSTCGGGARPSRFDRRLPEACRRRPCGRRRLRHGFGAWIVHTMCIRCACPPRTSPPAAFLAKSAPCPAPSTKVKAWPAAPATATPARRPAPARRRSAAAGAGRQQALAAAGGRLGGIGRAARRAGRRPASRALTSGGSIGTGGNAQASASADRRGDDSPGQEAPPEAARAALASPSPFRFLCASRRSSFPLTPSDRRGHV